MKDNWKLQKIPKKMHCYWGDSRPLSYLRSLTVSTFSLLNPDWEIVIYVPLDKERIEPTWNVSGIMRANDYKGECYLDSLKELHNVTVMEVDFSDSVVEGAHDVHKSDFLRWHLLYAEGGLWSDFDIIYWSPMTSLKENTADMCETDSLFVTYAGINLAIGFLLAAPGNKIYENIIDLMEKCFNKESFQCIGSHLLKSSLIKDKLKMTKMDRMCVYPVIYNQLKQLNRIGYDYFKWEDSIGMHWYGGSINTHDAEKLISPEHNLLEGDIHKNTVNTLAGLINYV